MEKSLKTRRSNVRSAIFDIIRIFALFLLIISHLGPYMEETNIVPRTLQIDFYNIGVIAVTIFIILSGAILEYTSRGLEQSYRQFVTKRISRIYSMYFLCLIFTILALASIDPAKILHQFTLPNIFLSITGLFAFFGRWGGPILTTSWFIGLIVVLNMFFPLISRLMKKRPHAVLFMLLLISLTTRYFISASEFFPFRAVDWFPLSRIFEFGLGIYIVKVMNDQVWQVISFKKRTTIVLSYVSELSFPLFLINFPLLVITTIQTIHPLLVIFVYLVITYVASICILELHSKIYKGSFSKLMITQNKKNAAIQRIGQYLFQFMEKHEHQPALDSC